MSGSNKCMAWVKEANLLLQLCIKCTVQLNLNFICVCIHPEFGVDALFCVQL